MLFWFKQKTSYEMRISDWSSDVGSSDLIVRPALLRSGARQSFATKGLHADHGTDHRAVDIDVADPRLAAHLLHRFADAAVDTQGQAKTSGVDRSNHTVEKIGRAHV